MHLLEMGNGPLVILCHGFPELSISWRHQIIALSNAGYRVIAPDLRGFGFTEKPVNKNSYLISHLINDLLGIVKYANQKEASLVGQDMGSYLCWYAALMHPDIFKRVLGISFHFKPILDDPPSLEFQRIGRNNFFYRNYLMFDELAYTEMDEHVRTSLISIYRGLTNKEKYLSQSWTKDSFLGLHEISHDYFPDFIGENQFNFIVSQFKSNSFQAPLMWYQNFDKNWERLLPYKDKKIEVPALFIKGDRDPFYLLENLENLKSFIPGLLSVLTINNCGHFVQQEKPNELNKLMIDFFEKN